ncbi:MAG: 4-phosphoerythronate dehydrogenase PdxB [Victivallaceae bacterium]|nr:4-phosphoerythronate dehydrogenase PdxB [Victivallaceae bacterium]MDD3702878.1 4-phosphoerythronate dehydrogenase PdxB [Victivallaceae bacterium]MDD4318045.1 4-phosphoerythronate dehydrogenase PdxB [Victivallaceae bacterium]NLK82646.1 4-phosphoerythronate dehydrogenase PdxB [Lentisphaerota bacterium]
MKVVADDKIPFLKGVLEPYAEVVYLPGAKTAAADVHDADALITRTRTKCHAALLKDSNVKFIATATIGYDHIDTEYLDKNGIAWTNAPGCNSGSVAQYLTSALLNLAVKYKFKLHEKTLGIIGVGNVGTKVAKIADALGMKVILNDPPRAAKEGDSQFTSLGALIKEADIITMHVPLADDGDYPTYYLADNEFFSRMKQGAFFINSSRGEVCDGEALIYALSSGKLSGAVLDVWENEPDIDQELMKMLDFATPHIAGYSTDGKANGTAMSVNAVADLFNLPLKNWYPDDVPSPPNSIITAVDSGNFERDLLTVVSQSYNLAEDSTRLLNSPSTFEKQRGDYPLRREFYAYSVRGRMSPALRKTLSGLGFKIQE